MSYSLKICSLSKSTLIFFLHQTRVCFPHSLNHSIPILILSPPISLVNQTPPITLILP
ncbi:hypothetical protein RchiOBHm_Chr2g0150601 [Rosa chinensis]|uniref:Uncharacterized protein n=1 Tax=Rosa chinensis TaxID=74649 RepID=A0A2P6RZX8_ROSCH|nr:hypothetical protein RchiOBHm_Chr2g0150601 [Rosa chinensis]